MTPRQRDAIAKALVLAHATDVEFLSVVEMYDVTEEEAREIHDRISEASIAVSWKD